MDEKDENLLNNSEKLIQYTKKLRKICKALMEENSRLKEELKNYQGQGLVETRSDEVPTSYDFFKAGKSLDTDEETVLKKLLIDKDDNVPHFEVPFISSIDVQKSQAKSDDTFSVLPVTDVMGASKQSSAQKVTVAPSPAVAKQAPSAGTANMSQTTAGQTAPVAGPTVTNPTPNVGTVNMNQTFVAAAPAKTR